MHKLQSVPDLICDYLIEIQGDFINLKYTAEVATDVLEQIGGYENYSMSGLASRITKKTCAIPPKNVYGDKLTSVFKIGGGAKRFRMSNIALKEYGIASVKMIDEKTYDDLMFTSLEQFKHLEANPKAVMRQIFEKIDLT